MHPLGARPLEDLLLPEAHDQEAEIAQPHLLVCR